MTPEILSGAAGVLLSLLFAYVPGLRDWYNIRQSAEKALLMLSLLVIVAGGSYALSCVGPFDYFQCTQAGGWQVVQVLIAALVANQATFVAAVRPFRN